MTSGPEHKSSRCAPTHCARRRKARRTEALLPPTYNLQDPPRSVSGTITNVACRSVWRHSSSAHCATHLHLSAPAPADGTARIPAAERQFCLARTRSAHLSAHNCRAFSLGHITTQDPSTRYSSTFISLGVMSTTLVPADAEVISCRILAASATAATPAPTFPLLGLFPPISPPHTDGGDA